MSFDLADAQSSDGSQPDEWLRRALSALAHPVRIRILRQILASDGCYCSDLVDLTGLAQSTVSHHLRALREANLIVGSREGTYVSYSANRDAIKRVKLALIEALE